MTRTAKHGLYMAVIFILGLVLLVAFGFLLARAFPDHAILMLALAGLSFFIPGRILAHYWSDYFEGQKLQRKGKHLEAIVRFERFLKAIKQRPSLKRLIWLSEWIYTRDVEVLILNNIGVSYLRLNNLEQASTHLLSAARLDPLSPLPYYNLSVLYHAQGDRAQGDENLYKAQSLGYSSSSIKDLAKMTREGAGPTAGTKSL